MLGEGLDLDGETRGVVARDSIRLEDLAQLAGVSIATVSRALNDSALVNDKTKQLIWKLAPVSNPRPKPSKKIPLRHEWNRSCGSGRQEPRASRYRYCSAGSAGAVVGRRNSKMQR